MIIKEHAHPLELYACHFGYHLQSPTIKMMMHGSLKMTLRDQAVKFAKKKTFPSESPRNKQAS